MQLPYRSSNGAKIVVTFPRKADDQDIRNALLDIAQTITVADAA